MNIGRREVLCAGALVALAGARGAAELIPEHPRLTDAELDAAIPKTIGSFRTARGSDLVMPARDELSEKIYDAVLGRLYETARGEGMMLAVAYGHKQDYGLMLHRPEWCYPQQGFAITPTRAVALRDGAHLIPARCLSASRDMRHEQILYWTRIGTSYPQGPRETRDDVLRETVRGHIPDGVLVRLSMPGQDMAAALPRMIAFHRELTSALGDAGRKILYGA